MRVALITVVHGRHGHLERQLEMLARSQRPVDAHIVVALADPALASRLGDRDDLTVLEHPGGQHGLPLAAARNAGARVAAGRADLLIFLDVDCLPAPGLVDAYCDAAADPVAAGSLLCGPVAYLPKPGPSGYDLDRLDSYAPHPARPAPPPGTLLRGDEDRDDHRLFWSLSFAITTPDWDRVGGFCERYEGYGAEDTDLAFTARAAGVGVTWVGGARAHHQWHQTQTPPVGHLDDILRNAAIFHDRWGRWPMEGWLAAFVEMGLIRHDGADDRYVRIKPVDARETSPA